jgi:hypothetical protein
LEFVRRISYAIRCGVSNFEFQFSNFGLTMTGKAYYLTTLADWQCHAAHKSPRRIAPDDGACGAIRPRFAVSASFWRV